MKKINEYKAEQIQGQYIRLNANESNSIFSKGEIIDTWYRVTLNRLFNDEKEPDGITTISYSYGNEPNF